MADLLQALAEPRRRAILRIVWQHECDAGAIHRAIGQVTFGAISQHLRVLRESGAVRMRRDGRRRIYRADRAAVRPLQSYLEKMWAGALDDLKALAEADEAHTAGAPGANRESQKNPRKSHHRRER